MFYRLDKRPHFRRVFNSRRGFYAAGNVHGKGLNFVETHSYLDDLQNAILVEDSSIVQGYSSILTKHLTPLLGEKTAQQLVRDISKLMESAKSEALGQGL